MTQMFARAHNAEAQLEELMTHLKKVVVKRYGEVVLVPSAKKHIEAIHALMEEVAKCAQ